MAARSSVLAWRGSLVGCRLWGRTGPGTTERLSSIVASQVVLVAKNLPAKLETRVLSLGQEDPLEKEMITHSSTLAWKIPWPGEPGGLQFVGLQRVGHDWETEHVPAIVLSYE